MAKSKKVLRAHVESGVAASDILKFVRVPGYDNSRVLRVRSFVASKKVCPTDRAVKITVEVLDK